MSDAVNVDDVIAAYVKVRDKIDEIEKKHTTELRPYRDRLEKLEAWIQNALQTQNLQSFRGESGTAYLQEVTKAQVEDWTAVLNFMRENQLWELLEKRVSKQVVADYIESHGAIPPGVRYERSVVARVRRS